MEKCQRLQKYFYERYILWMGNKNKGFFNEMLLISKWCHIIGCRKNKNTFKKIYSVYISSADNKNTHFDYFVTQLPSRHLLVQGQQWKHKNNLWNLHKVNNKNTRATSMASLLCLYCKILTDFTRLIFLLFTLNQQLPTVLRALCTLRPETFARWNFCEKKRSQNWRNKLSRMENFLES